MLRAKAVKFKQGRTAWRDRMLTSTDAVGNIAGIPVVAQVVNAVNKNGPARRIMEKVLGVHHDATLPEFHSNTLRKRLAHKSVSPAQARSNERVQGQVVLFATCYGNRNTPEITADLVRVFEHNGIRVRLAERERCCGMPKLELGDLDAVQAAKSENIPVLARLVAEGWDIVAPIPSCVLMFKQEIPLLFPDDAAVQKVKQSIFDPFEYLSHWHRAGRMNTEFKNALGKIAYHVPCHQRVQNIGLKTRDILEMIPGTTVEVIERCSGHDGTYAVKREFHDISRKICRPVVSRIEKAAVDHYISDCPMAGVQIQDGLSNGTRAESPFALMRQAYGL
jgi:Fe-S oxidoreductase